MFLTIKKSAVRLICSFWKKHQIADTVPVFFKNMLLIEFIRMLFNLVRSYVFYFTRVSQ